MKRLLFIAVCLFGPLLYAQVGIGNVSPNATLDISATNVSTPTNTDGILIPRMDEFPAANPTAAQDGMMVFITGAGSVSEGFYYWDNDAGPAAWTTVGGADSDWTLTGSNMSSANSGNIGIGVASPTTKLDIEQTTSTRGMAKFTYNYTGSTSPGYALEIYSESTGTAVNIQGAQIKVENSASATNSTGVYGWSSASSTNNTGVRGAASGSGSTNVGVSGSGSNATNNFGGDFGASSAGSANFGIRAYASNATTNWAAYFGLGTAGTGNVYVGDLLEVDGSLNFTDGNEALGYVLRSDASGNASWVDPTTFSTNVANYAMTKIRMSAAQVHPVSNWTKQNFDTAVFDIGSNFDTTTDRFNVTEAGYYRVNASYRSSGNILTNDLFGISIYVNGSAVKTYILNHYTSGAVIRDVSTLAALAVGDYVEIYFFANGALTVTNSTVYTEFNVERIR